MMNSNRDKLCVWLWFYFYCFGVCSRLGNLEIWSKHHLQRPGNTFPSLFLVTQKELPIFKSQHFSWWYPMKTTICFMVNHPNSVESATKTIPANSKKKPVNYNSWVSYRYLTVRHGKSPCYFWNGMAHLFRCHRKPMACPVNVMS